MDNSVSPFDIPLIVDHIAQYLNKKDLINCIYVSKAFNGLFKRYAWCDISKSLDGLEDPLTSDHRKAILENGQYIRKLSIDESNPGELLEFLASQSSPCKNLLELSHSAEEMYFYNTRHLYLANLVKNNIHLQKLKFNFEEDGEEVGLCSELIDIIKEHPSLRELDTSVTHHAHYDYEEDFLQNLPKTIETLKLNWTNLAEADDYEKEFGSAYWEEEDEDDEEDDDDDEDEDDEDNYGTYGAYPQLKSITTLTTINKQHVSTTLSLISGCPGLARFRTGTVTKPVTEKLFRVLGDVQKFPNLSELHIEQATFTESDWNDLLNRTQGRIKSFSIGNVDFLPTPTSFVQAMAAHWAESLESLQFWKYISLSSADIDLILSTCSKLKTFAISCPQELIIKLGQDRRLGLDAWNTHEDHGNAVTWACLELENLEVMFLDNFDTIATGNPNSNGASGPTDDSNQQEQAIANGIESIYRKLGCLTKLRRIRVGWQNIHGVFPKRKSLDMSIESGLKHMGRLKNLETLDLRDIYSAGIGQDEVEWMAENWPKLWEIKGLFHKPKRDLFERECGLDDEVEELMHSPDADNVPHFQWLKRRRPNIMIC